MINLNKSNLMKYPLFGSLYISEGLQLAIATVIIPVYFLEKNFSPELATFIPGMIMIPWTIKFVFGWITDHYIQLGRKHFIILGGLVSATSLITLAFIDPAVFLIPFMLILFIGHCGIGFLDVSSDAWAIEITDREERGRLNGVMSAGLFTGMSIGTSLIAVLAQIRGYNIAFLTAGIFILLIALIPLLVEENKKIERDQKVAPIIINEFRKKTTQMISFFLPVVAISGGIIEFTIPIYMKISLQLNIAQIGLIATVFTLMRVTGSLFFGEISDKKGRKNALYIVSGLSVFFTASIIFANNWQILTVLYGIIGFLNGGLFSVLFATCMDITNPKVGATQFSILVSLSNTGELGGGAASGTLISLIGFGRVFLYSAWLFGPSLLILYFIKLKKQINKTQIHRTRLKE